MLGPSMTDFSGTLAGFSWDAVRHELDGLPHGQGLNIAHEAVDQHASSTLRNHPAIRWIGRHGASLTLTYADLRDRSNRFANVLRTLGVRKGERVFSLAGQIPEVHVAALGTLKNGSVFCPLFSAFGPEPIYQRLFKGDAKVLVTTPQLYHRKLTALKERLPELEHVLLTEAEEDAGSGLWSLPRQMAAASPDFAIPPTDPEDVALLHFTSGTTGTPKGAVHVHNAVLVHYLTGKSILDFQPDDVFWCTADPGWVTGVSYGLLAPLLHGITNVIVDSEFDADGWYDVLDSEGVTVWYTAPTAIRRLMRLDTDPRRGHDLSRLRSIFSVGEPLNPDAIAWARRNLGLPIHDTWWQTETGAIVIANSPTIDIRPGSMGKPLPGIEAAIVHRKDKRTVSVVQTPDVEGELALRAGWPSMFRGYLHEEDAYRRCFAGEWYLTGDVARQDADGYFWFVGRADDIIKTSGHRVGPFEVESVLMEHPAVAEAGVIGKPDPLIGETVKAFVTLKTGATPGDALRKDILGYARRRLGAAIAPREVEFLLDLPKTKSGKIIRRALKAGEVALSEGDVS